MSLAALCSRQSTSLRIMAALDEVGLQWRKPQTEAQAFVDSIAATQPRFALITQEYFTDITLFSRLRTASAATQLVVCVTADDLTIHRLLALIDTLDFDVACTLPELTCCLQTLASGRYYTSSLLKTTPAGTPIATLPGFANLTTAERRVLRGICEHKTGPQIAEALFLSEKTINNHKYELARKLQATGGPGSLTRFVNKHREQLLQLLARAESR